MNQKHVPALDGIRALAIGAVMIAHLWQYPPGYGLLNHLATSGRIGVDLFFVLSGFLITGILWRTRTSPGYFKNFYGRRALRIFPVYFAFMFVVLVLMPSSHDNAAIRQHWPLYAFFMSNFDIAAHGWQLRISDVTWSLAVEEQFYLVWPFLLRMISAKAVVRLCLALIALGPIAKAIAYVNGVSVPTVYVLTPFRIDAFAMGALVAIVLQERMMTLEALKVWARRIFIATALPIAALCALNVWDMGNTFTAIGFTLIGLFATSLLVLSLGKGRIASFLMLKPLQHVGKVSYGMYLYHSLCVVIVSKAFEVSGFRISLGNPIVDSVAFMVIVAFATIAAATLSFKFFEMPFLRLKRFFEQGKTPAPAQNDTITPSVKNLEPHAEA